MKKSLIALAVLAASGAVMAQSSVTLYGLVDAGIGQTSTEATGAAPSAKLKQNVVNSNILNNSRYGFKGSEDLGGGLKANFTLEQGFSVDTGNSVSSTQAFSRKAVVGLSGDFGAVDLGRQYSAYDDLRGATNMIYDTNFATTSTVFGTGRADYTNRIDNSIGYRSPSFGGISGGVVLGLGENKTPGLSATKNVSAHIKYANGPIVVGFAHQAQDGRVDAVAGAVGPPVVLPVAASNSAKIKYNLIAGSYDFGVAKLTGGYNQAKQSGLEDKEYQIGVSVPFGAAAVAAGYSNAKGERAGAADLEGQGVSVVGTYSLSKRTTLYAGYLRTEVETAAGAGAPTETKKSTVATGVRHTF
jgi:predicted porin